MFWWWAGSEDSFSENSFLVCLKMLPPLPGCETKMSWKMLEYLYFQIHHHLFLCNMKYSFYDENDWMESIQYISLFLSEKIVNCEGYKVLMELITDFFTVSCNGFGYNFSTRKQPQFLCLGVKLQSHHDSTMFTSSLWESKLKLNFDWLFFFSFLCVCACIWLSDTVACGKTADSGSSRCPFF